MTSTPSKPGSPVVPAAAIRPGYKVGYVVEVNGKELMSRGEVFAFRRVGHNRAEITLLHAKTGSLFTNVVKANFPVQLTAVCIDPDADAVTKMLTEHLVKQLGEQATDFYAIFPIED